MARQIHCLLLTLLLGAGARHACAQTPVTGTAVPEMTAFDEAIPPLLDKWKVPGAALAIADGGRLVYARGFGYADAENKVPVQPFSLFRIASISKTITAVAIMKLVEEGKLDINARIGTLLPELTPLPGRTVDPRVRDITVLQLLCHLGGWDRTKIPGGDPALAHTQPLKVIPAPPALLDLARYSISSPLSFAPGTGYAYSNTGYLILGRIVEKAAGKKYEDYVRESVLGRMGIGAMRMGRTLASQRLPDEVGYYDVPGKPPVPSVVPGQSGAVPAPYGGEWMVELLEADGGWTASAIDLLRYVTALDGRRGQAFLKPETIASMLAKPPFLANPNAASWYAKGWTYSPLNDREGTWQHNGSLHPGSRSNLVRFASGRSYAVIFNSRPADESPIDNSDPFQTDFTQAINAAFGRVARFPTHDLFPQYAGQALRTSAETLTFYYQNGNAPPAVQTLSVTTDGPLAIYHTVSANNRAVQLDKPGGFTDGAYQVKVDPAGLDEGTYPFLLNIASSDARNSPRTVRVELRIYGPLVVRNAASRVAGPVAPGSIAMVEAAAVKSVSFGGIPARLIGPTLFLIPPETAVGETALSIQTDGIELRGTVAVEGVAPGLFSAAGDGRGPARASAVRTASDGGTTTAPVYSCDEASVCSLTPVEILSDDSTTELVLQATGLRAADPAALAATIGDEPAEIAGLSQAPEEGIDLIRLRLSPVLTGRGELDVVITAGERRSNSVKIAVK